MIPGFHAPPEAAFGPPQDPGHDRDPRSAGPNLQVGEALLRVLPAEAPGQGFLSRPQDRDTEPLRRQKDREGGRVTIHAYQEEGGIQGNRGEGVGREAHRSALPVRPGDQGHARGEVAHHVPEVGLVNAHLESDLRPRKGFAFDPAAG